MKPKACEIQRRNFPCASRKKYTERLLLPNMLLYDSILGELYFVNYILLEKHKLPEFPVKNEVGYDGNNYLILSSNDDSDYSERTSTHTGKCVVISEENAAIWKLVSFIERNDSLFGGCYNCSSSGLHSMRMRRTHRKQRAEKFEQKQLYGTSFIYQECTPPGFRKSKMRKRHKVQQHKTKHIHSDPCSQVLESLGLLKPVPESLAKKTSPKQQLILYDDTAQHIDSRKCKLKKIYRRMETSSVTTEKETINITEGIKKNMRARIRDSLENIKTIQSKLKEKLKDGVKNFRQKPIPKSSTKDTELIDLYENKLHTNPKLKDSLFEKQIDIENSNCVKNWACYCTSDTYDRDAYPERNSCGQTQRVSNNTEIKRNDDCQMILKNIPKTEAVLDIIEVNNLKQLTHSKPQRDNQIEEASHRDVCSTEIAKEQRYTNIEKNWQLPHKKKFTPELQQVTKEVLQSMNIQVKMLSQPGPQASILQRPLLRTLQTSKQIVTEETTNPITSEMVQQVKLSSNLGKGDRGRTRRKYNLLSKTRVMLEDSESRSYDVKHVYCKLKSQTTKTKMNIGKTGTKSLNTITLKMSSQRHRVTLPYQFVSMFCAPGECRPSKKYTKLRHNLTHTNVQYQISPSKSSPNLTTRTIDFADKHILTALKSKDHFIREHVNEHFRKSDATDSIITENLKEYYDGNSPIHAIDTISHLFKNLGKLKNYVKEDIRTIETTATYRSKCSLTYTNSENIIPHFQVLSVGTLSTDQSLTIVKRQSLNINKVIENQGQHMGTLQPYMCKSVSYMCARCVNNPSPYIKMVNSANLKDSVKHNITQARMMSPYGITKISYNVETKVTQSVITSPYKYNNQKIPKLPSSKRVSSTSKQIAQIDSLEFDYFIDLLDTGYMSPTYKLTHHSKQINKSQDLYSNRKMLPIDHLQPERKYFKNHTKSKNLNEGCIVNALKRSKKYDKICYKNENLDYIYINKTLEKAILKETRTNINEMKLISNNTSSFMDTKITDPHIQCGLVIEHSGNHNNYFFNNESKNLVKLVPTKLPCQEIIPNFDLNTAFHQSEHVYNAETTVLLKNRSEYISRLCSLRHKSQSLQFKIIKPAKGIICPKFKKCVSLFDIQNKTQIKGETNKINNKLMETIVLPVQVIYCNKNEPKYETHMFSSAASNLKNNKMRASEITNTISTSYSNLNKKCHKYYRSNFWALNLKVQHLKNKRYHDIHSEPSTIKNTKHHKRSKKKHRRNENGSVRQAVRVGSTFNFNVDFSKSSSLDNNYQRSSREVFDDATADDFKRARSGYDSTGLPKDEREYNARKNQNRRYYKADGSQSVVTKSDRGFGDNRRYSSIGSMAANKNRNAKGTGKHTYGKDSGLQSISKTYHKGLNVKPTHGRCFCTLKLQKKGKYQNTYDMSEKPTQRTAGQTTSQMRMYNLRGEDLKPSYELSPYECEPYVCIPEQCDPYECLERIKIRNLKRHTKDSGVGGKGVYDAGSKKPPLKHTKSQATYDAQYAGSNRLTPSSILAQDKKAQYAQNDSLYPMQSGNYEGRQNQNNRQSIAQPQNTRQVVRIGSNFSFNIEFFKDKEGNLMSPPTQYRKEYQNKDMDNSQFTRDSQFVPNYSRGTDRKYSKQMSRPIATKNQVLTQDMQADTIKYHTTSTGYTDDYVTATGTNMAKQKNKGKKVQNHDLLVGRDVQFTSQMFHPDSQMPRLKRCFCTIALHNPAYRDKKIRESHSTGVNMVSRGTKSPNEFVSYSRDASNNARRYKLEPYECEPGICTPGFCNPYECAKLIQKRLLREFGTTTDSNWVSAAATETKNNKTKKNKKNTGTSSPEKYKHGYDDTEIIKPPGNKGRTSISTVKNKNVRDNDRILRPSINPQNFDDDRLQRSSVSEKYPNQTRPLISSQNQKQTVRLSSNFSFNIDFDKTRSTKPVTRPSIRNGDTGYQVGNERKDSKLPGLGTSLKRCFCTLKLQKLGKKHLPRASSKMNNKYISATDDIIYDRAVYKETGTKARQWAPDELEPYECEPGTCIPGLCNPEECYERIKQRNLRKSVIGKKKHPYKSTVQSYYAQNFAGVSEFATTHSEYKQICRIGSNTNINEEFYKNKVLPDNISIYRSDYVPRSIGKGYIHKNAYNNINNNNENMFNSKYYNNCEVSDNNIESEFKVSTKYTNSRKIYKDREMQTNCYAFAAGREMTQCFVHPIEITTRNMWTQTIAKTDRITWKPFTYCDPLPQEHCYSYINSDMNTSNKYINEFFEINNSCKIAPKIKNNLATNGNNAFKSKMPNDLTILYASKYNPVGGILNMGSSPEEICRFNQGANKNQCKIKDRKINNEKTKRKESSVPTNVTVFVHFNKMKN